MVRTLFLLLAIVNISLALKCYEGTLQGLENNTRTEEKHCSGISNYCIQKIDKRKNQIRRECSSFMDEHNMEEKCPMPGCHWQSPHETFCCCQFDGCNEWKADGTEYKKGETVPLSSLPKSKPAFDKPREPAMPSFAVTTTVRTPKARNDEINLD
ncbi:hypothetical protein Y032_0279g1200 [Ancylostoma ceylanicum]|uniref:Uncharacterized protein n=1 Tax=Ancylostoma ceylanicum TaxID=53326 RepID=A0A016S6X6_9BILA|nr:hypothetical protein Y032_0279g1200 [Ancylostoma ceylanicum]